MGMSTDSRHKRGHRFSLKWRLFVFGLLVAVLALGSLIPTWGPATSTADDAITLDLDDPDSPPRRPKLWTSVSLDSDGYRELTFEHFSDFQYQPPGGARIDNISPPLPLDQDRPFEDRIPENLRSLDGAKVAVLGFSMPLAGSITAMTQFVLVRNMMICCYGVAPEMNEWIFVEARSEQKIRYHQNIPVVLRGVLHVNEVVEKGFVISLFEMEAHDLRILDYREFEAYYQRTGVK